MQPPSRVTSRGNRWNSNELARDCDGSSRFRRCGTDHMLHFKRHLEKDAYRAARGFAHGPRAADCKRRSISYQCAAESPLRCRRNQSSLRTGHHPWRKICSAVRSDWTDDRYDDRQQVVDRQCPARRDQDSLARKTAWRRGQFGIARAPPRRLTSDRPRRCWRASNRRRSGSHLRQSSRQRRYPRRRRIP